MKTALLITALLLLALLVGLLIWRALDSRATSAVWHRLAEMAQTEVPLFDPATLADLPEPAQRYFGYTIAPGTPLRRVAVFEMTGEIGLGTRDAPGYRAMTAQQILSVPHGLVWRLNAGAISGSDMATTRTSWTRFWLYHLAPVVRVGDTTDHLRSAYGRVIAEGAMWTPAALLPGPGVSWQALGPDSARVTVTHAGQTQSVDITVAANGQPTQVQMMRWSNANPDAIFRLQSFGGTLSDFHEVMGYRIPFHVEGGNHFGTPDYFAFYKTQITNFTFRP